MTNIMSYLIMNRDKVFQATLLILLVSNSLGMILLSMQNRRRYKNPYWSFTEYDYDDRGIVFGSLRFLFNLSIVLTIISLTPVIRILMLRYDNVYTILYFILLAALTSNYKLLASNRSESDSSSGTIGIVLFFLVVGVFFLAILLIKQSFIPFTFKIIKQPSSFITFVNKLINQIKNFIPF